jgi:hypothetical protein
MGRTRLRGFAWAGVKLAIEVPAAVEWQWPEALVDRTCHPEDADVHVSVERLRQPSPACDVLRYAHQGRVFEAGREGRDHVVHIVRDGRVARFDPAFRWARIALPDAAARAGVFPLASPLDDLLLIHRVIAAGGLVLRAMAAVRQGRALVILGDATPAPPGPSTALWSGWLVLQPGREGFDVYPLPSTLRSGARSRNALGARLEGLHLLDSAADDDTVAATLDPEIAAAELLRFAFAPLGSASHVDPIVEAATVLARRVPVLRLAGLGGARFAWRATPARTSLVPPAGA